MRLISFFVFQCATYVPYIIPLIFCILAHCLSYAISNFKCYFHFCIGRLDETNFISCQPAYVIKQGPDTLMESCVRELIVQQTEKHTYHIGVKIFMNLNLNFLFLHYLKAANYQRRLQGLHIFITIESNQCPSTNVLQGVS